ncbi:MAG: hypothetical protein M1142_02060 [Patescibacteria group bacterium]|nr:hypothetical protein [Patescibacteria group bacterium]
MNRQKGLAPILIVVLVTLIAVGGYLIYQKQFKLVPVPQSTQSSPSPVSQNESSSSAETANWKTYTNKTYKYKFNYPENWYIQTLGDNRYVYISDQKLDIKNGIDSPSLKYDLIDISYNPPNQIDMPVTAPIGTKQKLSQSLSVQKIADLNIDGRPGAKINFIDQRGNKLNEVSYWVSLLDNGTLQISATSSAKINMVDQILSTFKFTN